jgi:hypothetical protein
MTKKTAQNNSGNHHAKRVHTIRDLLHEAAAAAQLLMGGFVFMRRRVFCLSSVIR